MLLASDTGHFSLIRALHMADLITELNGKFLLLAPLVFTSFRRCTTIFVLSIDTFGIRLLWRHVRLQLHAVLSRRAYRIWQPLGCVSIYAVWIILRLYGR